MIWNAAIRPRFFFVLAASPSSRKNVRMARRQKPRGKRTAGPGQYDKASWDEWIEDTGVVVRLLNEDHDDVPHQRFVLRLASGQTLLIAHNLDIADRAPVGVGDRVGFRGVYEWNREGGVVHWTHHDPQGGEDNGYLRFRDRIYA